MYPYKHVLMENAQPRQIGAMQWLTLQPQFCCLSQLQFSQEPEGKKTEENAMQGIHYKTILGGEKKTIFTGSEEET